MKTKFFTPLLVATFLASAGSVLAEQVNQPSGCGSMTKVSINDWHNNDVNAVWKFGRDVGGFFAAECLELEVTQNSSIALKQSAFTQGLDDIALSFEILPEVMDYVERRIQDDDVETREAAWATYPKLVFLTSTAIREVVGPDLGRPPAVTDLLGKTIMTTSCERGDMTELTSKPKTARISAVAETLVAHLRLEIERGNLPADTKLLCETPRSHEEGINNPEVREKTIYIVPAGADGYSQKRDAAYESGEVDFVHTSLPAAMNFVDRGHVIYIKSEELPPVPHAGMVVRQSDYYNPHKRMIIESFMRAYKRSVQSMHESPESLVNYMVATLESSDNPEVMSSMIARTDGQFDKDKTTQRAQMWVDKLLARTTDGCFPADGLEMYRRFMWLPNLEFFAGKFCEE